MKQDKETSLSGFPEIKEEEAEKSQAQLDYEQGMSFLNDKEETQAAAAFHNAIVGFEQDKDEKGIANAAVRLADICFKKHDFVKAMNFCGRAYDICSAGDDTFSLICIKETQAKIYSQWGKYKEAVRLYIELVADYNDTRNPQGAVNSLETLAELYLKGKEKDKAADCYKTIASIHKSFKHVTYYGRYLKKAESLLKE
ncbi:MAG: tetratricopeptide repeat protein [Deltaproteobacteria bacterium]|nr:tetratricopeptide repeat protein [Deltaproteobacteria bacterium]